MSDAALQRSVKHLREIRDAMPKGSDRVLMTSVLSWLETVQQRNELARLLKFAVEHSNARQLFSEGFIEDARAAIYQSISQEGIDT